MTEVANLIGTAIFVGSAAGLMLGNIVRTILDVRDQQQRTVRRARYRAMWEKAWRDSR